MTAAVTGDSANYSKEVTIKQQTNGWITTIDWPTDIATSAKGEVIANGKATVTYTPGTNGAADTVAVKYE